LVAFFFSSRRRHTRSKRDWSSDVCSSDLHYFGLAHAGIGFFQSNARAQQRIIAGLDTRAWAAALSAGTTEELSEDISQATAAEAAATKATLAALLLHRVRAHIHDPALLRIQQDLLR